MAVPNAFAATLSPGHIVDFNREIRPILSDACFRCHGPDAPTRKSGLRLDTEEGAKADLGGYQAVKPGDESASELIKRIAHVDPDERMPPPDAPRALSDREVQLLRLWVKQGARWAGHWAFSPPQRPPIPPVRRIDWPMNDVDRFILSQLEQEGISPSRDASASALLRRASLDLTGLPPTLAEQSAFEGQLRVLGFRKSWSALIDRLLDSDAYAEHMTAQWLYAARYADTNGYQKDDERQMWPWRDWVLRAFKSNMPFDRFTLVQTAGDLLPNATLDDRIATGFHRNHRMNSEGGIIDAEFRAEYLADRVDTTATVWLGVTLGCARCHDHKYDPFSQRDYYRFSAFFASVPERGRSVGRPNAPPFVLAPNPAQALRLDELRAAVAAAQARLVQLRPLALPMARRWLADTAAARPPSSDLGFVADGLRVAIERPAATGDAGLVLRGDGDRFSGDAPFSLVFGGALPRAGAIAAQQEDDVDKKGWLIAVDNGELVIALVNRWLDDGLRLKSRRKLPGGPHERLLVTYDGSRYAQGFGVWLDGQPVQMEPVLDSFVNTATTDVPLRLCGDARTATGSPREFRIYDRVLSHAEVDWLSVPESLLALASKPQLSQAQEGKLMAGWWQLSAPEPYRSAWHKAIDARRELSAFTASVPTSMVLAEGAARPTYVLTRGEYDKPGVSVSSGIPSLWSSANMQSRLDLGRWLASSQNPLTARVFVNRMWQMMFGTGLVATSDNFGFQGDVPSHPELLDYLAVTFIESGWNVKALLRRLALSRTYQQSSDVSSALLKLDPRNRWLARASRLRLPAEVIRDQALAAADLLTTQFGGPPVRLPQPFGVWEDNGGPGFVAAPAPEKYRRSLYAFWKRTAPPPSLTTFDAPSRETCAVRPARTNTPLQALAMMNDPVQVEAAQALAHVARAEASRGARADDDFIVLLFKRVLARGPQPTEIAYVRKYITSERQRAAGSAQIKPDVLAAMLVLNLDETINRP